MMQSKITIAFLLVLVTTPAGHTSPSRGQIQSIANQPPFEKKTLMSSPEVMFVLAVGILTAVSLFERTSSNDLVDKWTKISRVFPSYQLWRGHFDANDKEGPNQLCRDWMPHLRPPFREEELYGCFERMMREVGDPILARNRGYFTQSTFIQIGVLVLRIFVAFHAISVFLVTISSSFVFSSRTKTTIDKNYSDFQCPPLASSDTIPLGAYENVDYAATACTDQIYGTICDIICARGYKPSSHYSNRVICALDYNRQVLEWVPNGRAYQEMCIPDIITSSRALVLHLSDYDTSSHQWLDNSRSTHATYEPCWDELHTCVTSKTKVINHIPSLTPWSWISFDGSQSFRVSTNPFNGHNQFTLFAVINPRTRDEIANVQNIVQLQALSSFLEDSTQWDATLNALLREDSSCSDHKYVLTIIMKATGPRLGHIHIRLNGVPYDSGKGIPLVFRRVSNFWKSVVPLFQLNNADFLAPADLRTPQALTPPHTHTITSQSQHNFASIALCTKITTSPSSPINGVMYNLMKSVTAGCEFDVMLDAVHGVVSVMGGAGTVENVRVNDGEYHTIVMTISGTSLIIGVDRTFRYATLPVARNCIAPFEIEIGHSSISGTIKNIEMYTSPLNVDQMGRYHCDDGVPPITIGHSGSIPPATDFNPQDTFNGQMGEFVLYNEFLDPLIRDQYNLGRIESIEWHLANKWKFSDYMAPAKPLPPTWLLTPEGPMNVSVIDQGNGYHNSTLYRNVLHVTLNGQQPLTQDFPQSTTVPFIVTSGASYKLHVTATNTNMETCDWFNASQQEVVGDETQVVVGHV